MPGMIHCKDAKTIKEEKASAIEHDRRLYHHLVTDQKSTKVKERFYRKPYGKIGECFDRGDEINGLQ